MKSSPKHARPTQGARPTLTVSHVLGNSVSTWLPTAPRPTSAHEDSMRLPRVFHIRKFQCIRDRRYPQAEADNREIQPRSPEGTWSHGTKGPKINPHRSCPWDACHAHWPGGCFLFLSPFCFLQDWGNHTRYLQGQYGTKWHQVTVPTYRCTSDRPHVGRTSGGSHTWGPCPCPRSCADSLRFHSYRLLVSPKVYTRVYKQNNNRHC